MARKKRSLSASSLLILLGVGVFLITAICIMAFTFYDFRFNTAPQGGYDVYLFRGDRKVKRLGESEHIVCDGEDLINIETLSDYCSYGVAGDNSVRSIHFADGGYAEFSAGNACDRNGEKMLLEHACVVKGREFFVPLSFFEDCVDGLKFDRDEDRKRIYIDIAATEYALYPISVAEKPLSADDYFAVLGVSYQKPVFKSDLSAYEEYMDPKDRDAYIRLINYENFLDKDYIPPQLTDLVNTRKDGRTTQQMDLYPAKAMEAMLKEAAANGFADLSITSGYRSYNYQQLLFNNQVSALTPTYGDKAAEKAAEAVAVPGTSEHQSGLCCDLHNLPAASQSFADTDAYQWLIENCAEFGFILRFPKNKTDITKIMFEPWHYRYVGRYHAKRIMEAGLCLEEYTEMLAQTDGN
mgnify:CR=1 FL=1